MVVKASLRSYIVHHDQSGLSHPNHKGEKNGEYSQYNMHNVVNVNKAINDNIYTWGSVFSGQAPRGLTWLSRPHRGLT
jgi:hypothetical protein